MSGFSSEWLTLREPVDHKARSTEVISAIVHYFINDTNIRITDIGAGTGSTVRALSTGFKPDTVWNLLDNDPDLLYHTAAIDDDANTNAVITDLSQSLEQIEKGKPGLVTTSAFLDLVSDAWLTGFVQYISERKYPFYAALTYDGRTICSPTHEHDAIVLDAFNRHQQSNKGFGPALGPNAADRAIQLFREYGYTLCEANSDWIAGKGHENFLHMLLDGWVEAAIEIEPDKQTLFKDWLDTRKFQSETGSLEITVGHKDFFAVPD